MNNELGIGIHWRKQKNIVLAERTQFPVWIFSRFTKALARRGDRCRPGGRDAEDRLGRGPSTQQRNSVQNCRNGLIGRHNDAARL